MLFTQAELSGVYSDLSKYFDEKIWLNNVNLLF